ncbi:MAG: DUF3127 domain-containing protein [Bacteroides sp.]|nr:DUF3127 domain-containing protein [Bacteroides sp.]
MELSGRIILDIPMQTGTSKMGNPWKKKEWVLETFGAYPRKVKFHIFGDRAETIQFELGKDYTVSFDLESREFNGKWYTDVSVFAAREYVDATSQQPQGYTAAPQGMPYGGATPQPAFQQPIPQGGIPQYGIPQQPTFSPTPGGMAEEDLPF